MLQKHNKTGLFLSEKVRFPCPGQGYTGKIGATSQDFGKHGKRNSRMRCST